MAIRTLEAKARRAAQWDRELINCKNHPDIRCQKSAYVTSHRLCSRCFKAKHSKVGYARRQKRWTAKLGLGGWAAYMRSWRFKQKIREGRI